MASSWYILVVIPGINVYGCHLIFINYKICIGIIEIFVRYLKKQLLADIKIGSGVQIKIY